MPRTALEQARGAGRGAGSAKSECPARSPPSPTPPSSGCARCATRRRGASRRAVPRRGPADHRRGARQRPPARDHRFLARGREASARRRDHRRDRSRRRRGDRDDARHPLQDVAARTIRRCCSAPIASPTTALDRDRPRRRRRCGSSPRRCAIPGNIGTILRTGDAVGAGGLILIDDSADPFSVEAVRASMGAIFTQQVATARWDEFMPGCAAGPGQLVGTSLKADARLSRGRL